MATPKLPTIYVVEMQLSGFSQWVPLLHNGHVAAYATRTGARKVANEYKQKQQQADSNLLQVTFNFRVSRYLREEVVIAAPKESQANGN